MPTFIIFFLIFSLLVLIHELGHFLSAKIFGVKVEEFSFGFPPRIWGIKKGETTYSINAIPFGGFVRLWGHEEEVKTDLDRAFYKQGFLPRVMIILGGVIMNFFLGVLCFAIVYSIIGIPTPSKDVDIVKISPNSPAQQAGLKPGDEVVAIEAQGQRFEVANTLEFIEIVSQHQGQEISLKLAGGKAVKITPRTSDQIPENQGSLGVVIESAVTRKFYPAWQMPFRGAVYGTKYAISWGKNIVLSLGQMVVNLFKGEVPKDVAGPVGIYQMTGEAKKGGWDLVVEFLGILSINLAVINLVPFPGLDGAWLGFIGLEALTGKRWRKLERWASQLGFIFLILLMLLITYNDIRRIFF